MADLNDMLKQIRERTTPDQERFVDENMAIVDYIHQLLDEKRMKPIDLARKLEKTPAEISKWLSGTHNLTLQSITKIEAALDEDIIMTPVQAKSKYESIKYVTLKVLGNVNSMDTSLNDNNSYEDFKWSTGNCNQGIMTLKSAS